MKRLLPILSIILLTAIQSQGQARTSPTTDAADRIMKFYPNPATSVITFDMQNGYQRGLTLQVYSFIGKQVHEVKNVPARTTIDLADFNRGVYIYQLRDQSGRIIESGKFQVSK